MRARPRFRLTAISTMYLAFAVTASYAQPHVADSVQITILSSNLADGGTIGEWGFSALVEVDGHCVLFDTGWHRDTVLRNVRELDVDLSCVTDVVLSHFHGDHTGGLVPLVQAFRRDDQQSFARVHVAKGIFLPRRMPNSAPGVEGNGMIAVRDTLEAAGVEILEHVGPAEILPGVWMTGSVERVHPEKNYPKRIDVLYEEEWVVDFIPESQALTIVTPEGHIVVMGCGHAGVVNTLEHIQSNIDDEPIHALMGGLHLFNASDETLGWTSDRLRRIGVENLMAGHCTGIEPLIRLRQGLNLSRKTAVVGSVGSRFKYGHGIEPGFISM